MANCLICNKIIELSFYNLLVDHQSLCISCLNKFKTRNTKIKIGNYETLILYEYNLFFKDLLYRFKGTYDYPLKDCFLNYFKEKIKRKYKGYVIIPSPSFYKDDIKRGFNHVEEIFKTTDLNIIKYFYKTENWKQSNKSKKERTGIKKIIKYDKTVKLDNKKILIVDDVATTFSTIKTMIRLIPPNNTIKVLILASNCQNKSIDLI